MIQRTELPEVDLQGHAQLRFSVSEGAPGCFLQRLNVFHSAAVKRGSHVLESGLPVPLWVSDDRHPDRRKVVAH